MGAWRGVGVAGLATLKRGRGCSATAVQASPLLAASGPGHIEARPHPPPRCPAPCRRQVEFSATKTICDVRVDSVVDARTGQPVKYGSRTQLVTEAYSVQ